MIVLGERDFRVFRETAEDLVARYVRECAQEDQFLRVPAK